MCGNERVFGGVDSAKRFQLAFNRCLEPDGNPVKARKSELFKIKRLACVGVNFNGNLGFGLYGEAVLNTIKDIGQPVRAEYTRSAAAKINCSDVFIGLTAPVFDFFFQNTHVIIIIRFRCSSAEKIAVRAFALAEGNMNVNTD